MDLLAFIVAKEFLKTCQCNPLKFVSVKNVLSNMKIDQTAQVFHNLYFINKFEEDCKLFYNSGKSLGFI
jgi:hypothetical protein